MQSHLLEVEFQRNATRSRVLITVVVGSATVVAAYAEFHDSALAVPLSVRKMNSGCPSEGVPVGAAIVGAVERADSSKISIVSQFGVGVAFDASVNTRIFPVAEFEAIIVPQFIV